MKQTFLHIALLEAFLLTLPCCRPNDVPPQEEPSQEQPGEDPTPPGLVADPDAFDYSVLETAAHPRLLMREADWTDLKQRLGKDKAANQVLCDIHHVIIVKAQAYAAAAQLTSDPSAHENNVAEILALCYAYRTTGNASFRTKLLKDLEAAAKWKNLGSSDLGLGEHSLALAIAYDWFYDELGESLRSSLASLLLNKAVKGGLNGSFRGFYGNWNQVGNSGVMSAALAIYESDPKACALALDTGLKDNKKTLQIILEGGGGYPEGAAYWNYGMTYEVALLESIQIIFGHTAGLRSVEGLMDSGEYALMVHGTMNTTFSYADGGTTNDQHMLASWWYAAQKKDASLAYAEDYLLRQEKYLSSYSRLMPLVPLLLKSFPADAVRTGTPSLSLWHCDGQAPLCIVRRGWTYSAQDLYLGIKGGNCNTWKTMVTAHGHMDAGSFVFEAEGVRWSDDVMRPAYGDWFAALEKAGSRSGDTSQSGLRWSTFNVNALCHSTLVSYANDGSVKGKLHPSDQYVDGHASILEVLDSPQRQGAVLDMSAPMKGQVQHARRTLSLLADGTLEIVDEIEALPTQDCPLEWRMLTYAKPSILSNAILLTSRTDDDTWRRLSVSCSESAIQPVYATWDPGIPADWSGFTYYQAISKRVLAGWKATVPAGQRVRFTTLLKKN